FALSPLPSLSGTVTDANDGAPIEDALVTATSGGETVTSITGEDGTYQMFLEIGTWTISYEAENYTTETREVVFTEDGQQIVQDVALNSPAAAVTPGAVDTILLAGWQRTFNVRLTNVGSSRLSWEAFESPRGSGANGAPARALEEPTAAPRRIDRATGPSNVAPEGYTATAAERRIQQDGPALVLQDVLPWGSDAIEQVLTDNGFEYDVGGSGDFGTIDLFAYEAVFVANDQPQGFYNAFEANLGRFEDYVASGGVLWFGGSAWGFGGGSPDGMQMPGGGTLNGPIYEGTNDVVAPDHPLAEGLPDPFSGTSASHAVFRDLPDGTVIATGTSSGEDTLIEYPLGAGLVLAVGQTVEFGYANGQDAGIILENGVPYAMAFDPFLDIPWLDVTPDSGGLAPGRSQRLQISIDTTGLEPGVYNAAITLVTNAAKTPRVTIPIRVVVTPYLQGVNTGGDAFMDRSQDPWAADQAFDGSWGYEHASDATSTDHGIGGTRDDALYQDARTGGLFAYRFDNLPDGVYEVELHFAEIQRRRPGDRLFDVTADTETLLVAYDIAEDVGRFQAVVHRFFVDVNDGRLRIRFIERGGFDEPIVNAVQLTHRPDLTG
ncbi:MAG: malectin domain-containing carbohydrate-binding protein, partial [Acidimicrobiales bacterium]